MVILCYLILSYLSKSWQLTCTDLNPISVQDMSIRLLRLLTFAILVPGCPSRIWSFVVCLLTCTQQSSYTATTLGEACALVANQSVDCRATTLFTIGLNSAKVWNRGFNWPVFGVRMHKKAPTPARHFEILRNNQRRLIIGQYLIINQTNDHSVYLTYSSYCWSGQYNYLSLLLFSLSHTTHLKCWQK